MSKKKSRITISNMYCTECGNRGIDIARRPGQQREAGHLKKLFCLNCQKETNHAEIRPFGSYTLKDFEEEFKLGRFINGNKIPIAELLSCSKINCEYNKNGKCWNSNYSFHCEHRPRKEEEKE